MLTTLDPSTQAGLLVAAGDPGNQKAREDFVRRYEGVIRDGCRRRGRQGADQEDVVQTILCQLLEKLPTFKYDPSKRFRGLLHIMISRAIVNLHRESQRHPGGCGSGDTGILNQLHEVPDPDNPAVEDLTQELGGQVERGQQLDEACERVRPRFKPGAPGRHSGSRPSRANRRRRWPSTLG